MKKVKGRASLKEREVSLVKDFEKIYSEYYDVVFRYVLSFCREEKWAEEITQEAFFKALKNIDAFRGECTGIENLDIGKLQEVIDGSVLLWSK